MLREKDLDGRVDLVNKALIQLAEEHMVDMVEKGAAELVEFMVLY